MKTQWKDHNSQSGENKQRKFETKDELNSEDVGGELSWRKLQKVITEDDEDKRTHTQSPK